MLDVFHLHRHRERLARRDAAAFGNEFGGQPVAAKRQLGLEGRNQERERQKSGEETGRHGKESAETEYAGGDGRGFMSSLFPTILQRVGIEAEGIVKRSFRQNELIKK